jgi:hypothetical protein
LGHPGAKRERGGREKGKVTFIEEGFERSSFEGERSASVSKESWIIFAQLWRRF